MESPTDPNIGQVIEQKYRLLQYLGHGAFGKVYLAEHLFLKTQVVIKLSHEQASVDEHAAFRREAAAQSRVNDPHFVRLLDFGIAEGRSFIVREYVEGENLKDLLSQAGRLEVNFSLRVAIAVAEGLAALHKLGILHRDIKPTNIIVPNNPDDAKLLDFGIVGKLEVSTGQTMAGQLVGTPYYMSPEQFEAEAQSPAADIYSLATTLYEMIFGTLPFAGPSLPSIMRRKFSGDITFPTDEVVPQSLIAAIRRALSPEAKDRQQSAEELIRELRDILTNNASAEEVRHTTPIEAPKENTHGMMTIVSVILAVGGTIAWLSWGARYQVIGIIVGLLYALCGVFLSNTLGHWIKSRRTEVEIESGNLLLSSRSRINLGASLAIEVDKLITKVRRLDDKILATSLAIMVNEFQGASEGQIRQAAIMNVVQLLEKLTTRLSPWYVRHEKLLAATVTTVGILSGITTVIASVIKIAKGN